MHWQEKEEIDAHAKWIIERFQHHSAIELYDMGKVKYCMGNIAEKPENKSVVGRMDKVLNAWMTSC